MSEVIERSFFETLLEKISEGETLVIVYLVIFGVLSYLLATGIMNFDQYKEVLTDGALVTVLLKLIKIAKD